MRLLRVEPAKRQERDLANAPVPLFVLSDPADGVRMRVIGTVKWFDLLRGFGVIRRDPGDADCFVHHSAMRGSLHHALTMGDQVEFDLIEGGAGAVAGDVIRLDGGLIPLTPRAV